MAFDVCPWWLGYLLVNPLRRLFENPDKLLAPYLSPGMTVLDVGCAMGFFTVPAVRLVGEEGRVIAVDLQLKMIDALKRRLNRRGLQNRVETQVCGKTDLGLGDLENRVDLVLLIHVAHEVPDRDRLFTQLYRALKPGGKVLFKEPKGHVSEDAFFATLAVAERVGFVIDPMVGGGRGHKRVLSKV